MYKYVKKSPLYAEFYSRNIMPFKPIPERDELQGRRDMEGHGAACGDSVSGHL